MELALIILFISIAVGSILNDIYKKMGSLEERIDDLKWKIENRMDDLESRIDDLNGKKTDINDLAKKITENRPE